MSIIQRIKDKDFPAWVAILIACFVIALFIIFCATTVFALRPTHDTAKDIPEEPAGITIDQALTSFVRSYPPEDHTRAKQVCYDSAQNGYLVFFDKKVNPEPDTQYYEGWYFILYAKNPSWQSANGTWFMGDIDTKNFVKVYPDITGLPCKEIPQ